MELEDQHGVGLDDAEGGSGVREPRQPRPPNPLTDAAVAELASFDETDAVGEAEPGL